MPPAARKPAAKKPAAAEPAEPRPAKAGDICAAHWPGGWPEGARTASCVHGNWTR